MHVMSPGRCLALALAVAASAGACARPPSNEHERNPAMSGATQTGRTLNGHTYTDAPVDVKLGPTTFRFPANYLDSQIAPWPGEGVTLVIEWPDMKPTAPGARADPRTNDFRKEIKVLIDYVDRVPIQTVLARYSGDEARADGDSVEHGDPAARLDLRIAQPETLGLIPYAIDEEKMAVYSERYQARYGRPAPRNPAYEGDWYVVRDAQARLTTFIKCDSSKHSADGLRVQGSEITDMPGSTVAGCTHYFVDDESKLSIMLSYNRVFLQDWKRMESAVRRVLAESKVK
ncbi:Smlt3025 familytype IV secretion system inhibitor [Stenotrophomonas maltophilia]|uniref:Smlt3025 familytype IV secretion system inhibitor n=1 Tax=Stenotrophomonas maltophilia TaxID=40324 RepID=UPI0013DD05FB|nr:hypothetical protein [Stenotrophomonas maltophilia]